MSRGFLTVARKAQPLIPRRTTRTVSAFIKLQSCKKIRRRLDFHVSSTFFNNFLDDWPLPVSREPKSTMTKAPKNFSISILAAPPSPLSA